MNILLIDSNKEGLNSYIIRSIHDAFDSLGVTKRVDLASYSDLINKARLNRYQLMLVVGGAGGLEKEIIQRASFYCERSFLWTTEDPYELSKNYLCTDLFDLILTNEESCKNKYRKTATFMPLAGSLKYHYRDILDDDKKLYDVSIIGSAWPNRTRFIKKLFQLGLDKLKYKICMPANPFVPFDPLPIQKLEYNHRVSIKDFCDIVNASRITINLFRKFTASSNIDTPTTTPPRVFETALAGGFQLTNEQNIRKQFSGNDDVLIFNTEEECINLINTYLEQTENRRLFSKNAQDIVMNKHTYGHRAKEILYLYEQFNTNKKLIRSQDKKNILYVTHNYETAKHFGGVEIYQKYMQEALSSKYNLFFYSPTPGKNDEYELIRNDDLIEVCHVQATNVNSVLFEPSREKKFGEVLLKYNIDICHFQHLLNHSLSLPLISKSLGVPSFFTIHDYYLICDLFNLMPKNVFCKSYVYDSAKCTLCCCSRGKNHNAQSRRLNYLRKVVTCFEKLFYSTNTSKVFFENYFSLDNSRFVKNPIPNVEKNNISFSSKQNATFENHEKLKIAIFGSSHNKGLKYIVRLLDYFSSYPVVFKILGRVEDFFLESVGNINASNYDVVGIYNQNELHMILQDCKFSLHLSPWPETYCMSLTESWRNQLTPIAFSYGALDDRIINNVTGYKFAEEEFSRLVSHLECILNDFMLLKDVKKHQLTIPEIPHPQAHVDVLVGEYENNGVLPHVSNKSTNFIGRYLNPPVNNVIYNHPDVNLTNTATDKIILPHLDKVAMLEKNIFSSFESISTIEGYVDAVNDLSNCSVYYLDSKSNNFISGWFDFTKIPDSCKVFFYLETGDHSSYLVESSRYYRRDIIDYLKVSAGSFGLKSSFFYDFSPDFYKLRIIAYNESELFVSGHTSYLVCNSLLQNKNLDFSCFEKYVVSNVYFKPGSFRLIFEEESSNILIFKVIHDVESVFLFRFNFVVIVAYYTDGSQQFFNVNYNFSFHEDKYFLMVNSVLSIECDRSSLLNLQLVAVANDKLFVLSEYSDKQL